MEDLEIRARLRGATAAGLLCGWQGPHLNPYTGIRSYCIVPAIGDAKERSIEFTISFCWMLSSAGIDPLWTQREPRPM